MHRRDTVTKAIVNVDLKKVRDNAERVVSHLPGIDIVAVTKATCGSPDVGAAGQHGGAHLAAAAGGLGDGDDVDAGQVRDDPLRVVADLLQIDVDDGLGQRVPPVHRTYASAYMEAQAGASVHI